jgi:adenylate kinase
MKLRLDLSEISTGNSKVTSETNSVDRTTNPLKIIIAGAPAAGKGTQCSVIQEKYNVIHLSTGDILRAAVKQGTELGLKAKQFMDAGQLVPDELIIGVVVERLNQHDCKTKGWLLDGFPRTESQAEALIAAGMNPDCFILLDVKEDILVDRVVGRRTDPITGKIYHLKYNPPENEEIAARVFQRSDDTEEKIKIRFKEFQTHIENIKSTYQNKMVWIDGSSPQLEVEHCIASALDSVLDRKVDNNGSDGGEDNSSRIVI